jgi:hypothetical protein
MATVGDAHDSLPSAKTSEQLGDTSIGLGEKADGVFVVTRLRVHSTKGETAALSDDTIKLEVPGGATYSADIEGSTAALLSSGGGGQSEEPFFLRDVQPDTTTTGLVVFDVPPNVLDRSQSCASTNSASARPTPTSGCRVSEP